MKYVALLGFGLSLAFGVAPVRSEVKLPAIFSDHMVLQSDAAVAVWGWAEPGESIAVSIDGQSKTTIADGTGKWSLKLDPLKAGMEARTLTIQGRNTLAIHDVLVGEV